VRGDNGGTRCDKLPASPLLRWTVASIAIAHGTLPSEDTVGCTEAGSRVANAAEAPVKIRKVSQTTNREGRVVSGTRRTMKLRYRK